LELSAQSPNQQAGRNESHSVGNGKKYKEGRIGNAGMSFTKKHPASKRNDRLLSAAMAKHQAGRIREAQDLYAQVIKNNPNDSDALYLAGLAAQQAGDNGLAVKLIERSLQTGPESGERHLNLGLALQLDGSVERALVCYEKAVALDPGNQMAHIRMGAALIECSRPLEAANSFKKALSLAPESEYTYYAVNGLGIALEKIGALEQAIVCFLKALSIRPDSALDLSACGLAFSQLNQIDKAIDFYKKALQINPKSSVVLSNMSWALRMKGQVEEAIRFCQRAIELDPQHANAHTNLGDAYVEQDKVEEALRCYQRAVAIGHKNNAAYSNMLYLHSAYQFASPEVECQLARGWEKSVLSDDERAAARARASVSAGVFSALPRNGRPLRLGIVSAELNRHAVGVFLRSFLDQLDRRRVHLTLFTTLQKKDNMSDHFRSLADAFIPVIGMPDEVAATRIREQQIDVLIDTSGHTGNRRLGIFAHRAAPVQCSYIGYWSTTGLTEMDWYISDENYSQGCDTHFTEKLWKLPHVAHCYHGDDSIASSTWTPDPDGTVWLGSFNRYDKIRRETLALWAKVLKAIPQAKLMLEDRAEHQEEAHQRILAVLRENGIAADRVVFLPNVMNYDFAAHMRLYDRVDIALDTVPANSGTTAFDALWMGVPLIALEGTRVCSRMAASIVKVLGKPEWIARTEDEYVSIVSALAGDVEGRVQLRQNLRSTMKNSELCDGKGLARSLEDAFEAMHDQWLRGEA